MPDAEHTDLVTVATTAALQEADVIRVSLAAAGIPAMVHGERTINVLTHMGPAIHPHGIRVMVLPEHAEDARALLEAPPADPEGAQDEREPEPVMSAADDYARRAHRAAWLSLAANILWPLAIYFLIRALVAVRSHPPQDPRQFRRRMAVAFAVAVCLPLGLVAAVLAIAWSGI